ncbi:MAG: two-component system response regulator [Bryobacteraceae bacterium]
MHEPPRSNLGCQSPQSPQSAHRARNMRGGSSPAILTISASEEDHRSLARILGSAEWRTRHARTLSEGLVLLREESASVVICEDRLTDGDWRAALHLSAQIACPPSFIVASRLADERLWAEVLNAGGFDLLLKPFDKKEVLWVATAAWRQSRERRPRARRAEA